MGSSSFSRDDYAARSSYRVATDTPVFTHDADIRAGKVDSKVHKSLSPREVKLRESRDSVEHPVVVPVVVMMDVTGSMSGTPVIFQAKLPSLMGHFLEDKASGKKYLGDGYP